MSNNILHAFFRCYIHQGTGLMTIGEKSYEIVAPAVVKIPPNMKHGLWVTGTETLLKLNAHSPPRTKALKRKLGAENLQPLQRKSYLKQDD